MSENNGDHREKRPDDKEHDVWQELLRQYLTCFPDPSSEPAALQRGMQDILRRAERKRHDDEESE